MLVPRVQNVTGSNPRVTLGFMVDKPALADFHAFTFIRRITTFRSTTDRIYDGGPIVLYRVTIKEIGTLNVVLKRNY